VGEMSGNHLILSDGYFKIHAELTDSAIRSFNERDGGAGIKDIISKNFKV